MIWTHSKTCLFFQLLAVLTLSLLVTAVRSRLTRRYPFCHRGIPCCSFARSSALGRWGLCRA